MSTTTLTFRVFTERRGFLGRRVQWRWHCKSANGEIIAQGEGYNERRKCEAAIGLLKRGVADAEVVYVEERP